MYVIFMWYVLLSELWWKGSNCNQDFYLYRYIITYSIVPISWKAIISTLNFLTLYKELKSEKWLQQEVFLKYPTPSFDCFVSDKVLVDTFDLYDLHL